MPQHGQNLRNKSVNELLEMTAKCVSLGGNFVLNFGPQGDGAIRQEELNLATKIGDWMKINQEAIYNCGYAGYEKQDWGYFTKKTGSDQVFMVVFNVPVSGALRLKMPAKTKISKAYMLADQEETFLPEEINSNEYFLQLKKKDHQQPFVIVLETLKNAENNGSAYEKAKT